MSNSSPFAAPEAPAPFSLRELLMKQKVLDSFSTLRSASPLEPVIKPTEFEGTGTTVTSSRVSGSIFSPPGCLCLSSHLR